MSSKQKGGSFAMGFDLARQMEGDKREVHEEPIGVLELDKMELAEAQDKFSRYLGEITGNGQWARKFIQEELDKEDHKDKKDRLMELARSYFSFIPIKYAWATLAGARKKKKHKDSKKKKPKKGSKKNKKKSKNPKKQGGGKSKKTNKAKPRKAKKTNKRPRSIKFKRAGISKLSSRSPERNNPYPF